MEDGLYKISLVIHRCYSARSSVMQLNKCGLPVAFFDDRELFHLAGLGDVFSLRVRNLEYVMIKGNDSTRAKNRTEEVAGTSWNGGRMPLVGSTWDECGRAGEASRPPFQLVPATFFAFDFRHEILSFPLSSHIRDSPRSVNPSHVQREMKYSSIIPKNRHW